MDNSIDNVDPIAYLFIALMLGWFAIFISFAYRYIKYLHKKDREQEINSLIENFKDLGEF